MTKGQAPPPPNNFMIDPRIKLIDSQISQHRREERFGFPWLEGLLVLVVLFVVVAYIAFMRG